MDNKNLLNKYYKRKNPIELDKEEEILIDYYNRRCAIEKSHGWNYDGTWLKRVDTLTKKYVNKLKNGNNTPKR